MPMFPCWPVVPVEICDVTPITRPAMSISGPPELPWLIAASVWIAWSIGSVFGASICRCTRADDAGRQGAREAEGVADREDRVADGDCVGVAERQRRQRAGVRVDLQDGDVGRRIVADDGRGDLVLAGERDLHLLRALDDVVVRDDVAGLVDHEARAERLLVCGVRRQHVERVGLALARPSSR